MGVWMSCDRYMGKVFLIGRSPCGPQSPEFTASTFSGGSSTHGACKETLEVDVSMELYLIFIHIHTALRYSSHLCGSHCFVSFEKHSCVEL